MRETSRLKLVEITAEMETLKSNNMECSSYRGLALIQGLPGSSDCLLRRLAEHLLCAQPLIQITFLFDLLLKRL